VANEKGTLTIKEVIGDSNLTYVLMDYTAPEGTVLDSTRYRFEYPMITTDHSTGFMLLDDENPNNNKISLVMKIITKNAIAGQTVTISVSPISISLKIESTSLKEIDKAAGRLKE
jgi:hypothetical protein